MPITANNPKRKSWLDVQKDSDFPIQNIPFGVFITKDDVITIGTRIGDYAIDLGALQQLNYFEGIELTDDMFMQDTLNDFISDGKKTWRLVRNRIANIFDSTNPELRDNKEHREIVVCKMENSRSIDPEKMTNSQLKISSLSAFETYRKLLDETKSDEGILITGSLYLIGEIKGKMTQV